MLCSSTSDLRRIIQKRRWRQWSWHDDVILTTMILPWWSHLEIPLHDIFPFLKKLYIKASQTLKNVELTFKFMKQGIQGWHTNSYHVHCTCDLENPDQLPLKEIFQNCPSCLIDFHNFYNFYILKVKQSIHFYHFYKAILWPQNFINFRFGKSNDDSIRRNCIFSLSLIFSKSMTLMMMAMMIAMTTKQPCLDDLDNIGQGRYILVDSIELHEFS